MRESGEEFIKELVFKTTPGDRLPIIFCVSQCSDEFAGLEPSYFDEMPGVTLVFSKGRHFDSQKIKSLENLIAEIKAELKCKHVLLIDCHEFQGEERSFRFFSHEESTDMTSIGFMLKGTFREQSDAVLDNSSITCEKTLLDYFSGSDRNVHCYQISFSNKLIADKEIVSKSRKTKFEFGIYAAALVAGTKMRMDAGEF